MNAVAGLASKEPPPAPSPEEPAPIVATRIDFPAYNLPEYADSYAVVIDNHLHPRKTAPISSHLPQKSEVWPEATINETHIDTSYRNSGRFVREEPELAAWILAKIRPYLDEIETVPETHANWRRGLWRSPPPPTMSSLRTDLRFLRYGPGHFFKPHGDGTHCRSTLMEIANTSRVGLHVSGRKGQGARRTGGRGRCILTWSREWAGSWCSNKGT
ncbi:hypothetical protein BS47DRAFT_1335736 [Hydnum rufescens UP504]|uniref:Uncharacterized protein n=1 Tax=Hydnum rufescens UP504 TaxID=1448309 RepID=A0A9P6DZI2_9AGAM|nr:hypothetical protein BS47DRAFT_1335736 [Hydnum rufescens UP504]